MTTTIKLTPNQRAALAELAVADRDPEQSSQAAHRVASTSTGGKRNRASLGRRRVIDNLIVKGLAERQPRSEVRRSGTPYEWTFHYSIVVITDAGRQAVAS